MKKIMMTAMVAALMCVAVVLGIYPTDRTVWRDGVAVEHIGYVILPED